MNDPVELRKYAREVMFLYRERWWTEKQILMALSRLAVDPLTVPELKETLLWNQDEGYIESKPDRDAAIGGIAPSLWKITREGIAKQNG